MALNKDKIFKAADKYIRANKIKKAINEYESWLKKNPKDWNTVRVVGDLYHRIGRNDEAIESSIAPLLPTSTSATASTCAPSRPTR